MVILAQLALVVVAAWASDDPEEYNYTTMFTTHLVVSGLRFT